MDLELETEVIDDRTTGPKQITGYVIGHVSTMMGHADQHLTEPRARWSENTVWKLRNGSYVAVRESWSRVYHTDPTRCRTFSGVSSGDPATVAEMVAELATTLELTLDEALACPNCRPPYPDELNDGDKIRYEYVRRFIDQCDTSAQVVKRLTHKDRTTMVSGSVKALLDQCKANDPDWGRDENAMEVIG